MKYWRNGFYDEPQEGLIEIPEEYYVELFQGQALGKKICENTKKYPVLKEYQYDIDELRKMKISQIIFYDKSEAINSFILNDKTIWFDKATRVGLMNSINIEKQNGKIKTVLWSDGMKYLIPIHVVAQMLNSLEMYALACYNVTQSHISTVEKLKTGEEIKSYDYTVGYPEHLTFLIS